MSKMKRKLLEDYESDYAYHLFMYGDLFVNILFSLHNEKEKRFNVPRRYKEVTSKTVKFYNKWSKHGTIH